MDKTTKPDKIKNYESRVDLTKTVTSSIPSKLSSSKKGSRKDKSIKRKKNGKKNIDDDYGKFLSRNLNDKYFIDTLGKQTLKLDIFKYIIRIFGNLYSLLSS